MEEMVSALEIYNNHVSSERNDIPEEKMYLKDILLEEAKKLVIKSLTTRDYFIWPWDNEKEVSNYLESASHTQVFLTIAETPGRSYKGLGNYKKWYMLLIYNKSDFPFEEFESWLKSYGWNFKFSVSEKDQSFCIELVSNNFCYKALNPENKKLPSYMRQF